MNESENRVISGAALYVLACGALGAVEGLAVRAIRRRYGLLAGLTAFGVCAAVNHSKVLHKPLARLCGLDSVAV